MSLSEFSRDLYRLTAKMNLYISSDAYKNNPDKRRVKHDIEQIKGLITEIEKLIG